MERRRNGAIVILVLFMVLFVSSQLEKIEASDFKSCFGQCLVDDCLDGDAPVECATKCLIKSAILKITQPDSLHYCNFGCSIHRCAKFGVDVEKVDRCVHNCKKITCNNLQH